MLFLGKLGDHPNLCPLKQSNTMFAGCVSLRYLCALRRVGERWPSVRIDWRRPPVTEVVLAGLAAGTTKEKSAGRLAGSSSKLLDPARLLCLNAVSLRRKRLMLDPD